MIQAVMQQRKRVVIVGAGFGGLWAARSLVGADADVLILDRNNYHTFPPLIYQVAAAEIEPEEIAFPVRGILRRLPGIRFGMYEVRRIDLDARTIETSCRDVQYDYLIIGAGSTTDFLGVPGASEHAFQLKTLEQAIHLRNHILRLFEDAACEVEITNQCRPLNIAIVGGGPTGIEFAGALAELIRGPFTKDYPAVDCSHARIILIEGSDRLLAALGPRGSDYAAKRLAQMGVEVRLRSLVTHVTPSAISLEDGDVIPTETTVWTAGARGDALAESWGLPVARGGRVPVEPTLQVPGHPEVYVVGDLAYVEEAGRPLPMTAPVAIQEGTVAAENIKRQLAGAQPIPFLFRDKGMMVTIGRRSAVARVKNRVFTGLPAWLLWLGVHIFNLIGFRNRLFVLTSWARDYFFHERAVRLILDTEPRRPRSPDAGPPRI